MRSVFKCVTAKMRTAWKCVYCENGSAWKCAYCENGKLWKCVRTTERVNVLLSYVDQLYWHLYTLCLTMGKYVGVIIEIQL